MVRLKYQGQLVTNDRSIHAKFRVQWKQIRTRRNISIFSVSRKGRKCWNPQNNLCLKATAEMSIEFLNARVFNGKPNLKTLEQARAHCNTEVLKSMEGGMYNMNDMFIVFLRYMIYCRLLRKEEETDLKSGRNEYCFQSFTMSYFWYQAAESKMF